MEPPPFEKPPVVVLRPAWAWDCPKCGQTCFTFSETWEPTEAEKVKQFGGEVPEGWDGTWQTAPREVMCRSCASTYPARGEGDES